MKWLRCFGANHRIIESNGMVVFFLFDNEIHKKRKYLTPKKKLGLEMDAFYSRAVIKRNRSKSTVFENCPCKAESES